MDSDQTEIRSLIMRKLSQLGMKDVKVISEGKQNYVYSSLMRGKTTILKVTDARHRRLEALQIQSEMLKELSSYSSAVCAPIDILHRFPIVELKINDLDFYVIAYPFAKGVTADINNPDHVDLMGTSLAILHNAMNELKLYAFDGIIEMSKSAAIAQVLFQLKGAETILANAIKHFEDCDMQLLHGDFNAGNLKVNGAQVRIFDFDNCVYGSTSYELAAALYMVLFGQVTQGELSVYHDFKKVFLEAYERTNPSAVDLHVINDLISYRVLLLASWLAQPDNAPLFIRQSSQQWLTTLKQFTLVYFEQLES